MVLLVLCRGSVVRKRVGVVGVVDVVGVVGVGDKRKKTNFGKRGGPLFFSPSTSHATSNPNPSSSSSLSSLTPPSIPFIPNDIPRKREAENNQREREKRQKKERKTMGDFFFFQLRFVCISQTFWQFFCFCASSVARQVLNSPVWSNFTEHSQNDIQNGSYNLVLVNG